MVAGATRGDEQGSALGDGVPLGERKPRAIPVGEADERLARLVVDPGGVIVKVPAALSAAKSRSTFVLLRVVVMLAAASLVPLLAPAVVDVTSSGELFSTPT